jgi:hypothetical protein
MAAITSTTTFGQMYIDPTENTLGTTEAEILALYRVIYSQYLVDGSPPTSEELEKDLLPHFLEPIGSVGIIVADSGSKTGCLRLNHCHDRYSSRPGRAHTDRGASFYVEG